MLARIELIDENPNALPLSLSGIVATCEQGPPRCALRLRDRHGALGQAPAGSHEAPSGLLQFGADEGASWHAVVEARVRGDMIEGTVRHYTGSRRQPTGDFLSVRVR